MTTTPTSEERQTRDQPTPAHRVSGQPVRASFFDFIDPAIKWILYLTIPLGALTAGITYLQVALTQPTRDVSTYTASTAVTFSLLANLAFNHARTINASPNGRRAEKVQAAAQRLVQGTVLLVIATGARSFPQLSITTGTPIPDLVIGIYAVVSASLFTIGLAIGAFGVWVLTRDLFDIRVEGSVSGPHLPGTPLASSQSES